MRQLHLLLLVLAPWQFGRIMKSWVLSRTWLSTSVLHAATKTMCLVVVAVKDLLRNFIPRFSFNFHSVRLKRSLLKGKISLLRYMTVTPGLGSYSMNLLKVSSNPTNIKIYQRKELQMTAALFLLCINHHRRYRYFVLRLHPRYRHLLLRPSFSPPGLWVSWLPHWPLPSFP